MPPELICATCGCRTAGQSVNKGSALIELILWCCFLVPGLLYTVWRRTSAPRICHACGAKTLVPLSTPVGKKLATEHPVAVEPPHPDVNFAAWARAILGISAVLFGLLIVFFLVIGSLSNTGPNVGAP
jgi:hypothetical protein